MFSIFYLELLTQARDTGQGQAPVASSPLAPASRLELNSQNRNFIHTEGLKCSAGIDHIQIKTFTNME